MNSARVAVVTGGGSGIGRAAALALSAKGYNVVVAGRNLAKLNKTAANASEHAKALAVAADVSDPGQVNCLFQSVVEEFGRIDVLFNNAGIGTPAVPIEDVEVSDWTDCVAVNLTGAFLCARQAVRLMKSQDPPGGRIINNGSVSAHTPRPCTVAYTATKHGITGLTKSISLDGRKHRIACSQIDIGNADTRIAAKFKEGVPQASGEVMIEPVFDVEHCGDAVAYIASLPLDVNIQFMTIMATNMPYIGRG